MKKKTYTFYLMKNKEKLKTKFFLRISVSDSGQNKFFKKHKTSNRSFVNPLFKNGNTF